MTQPSTRGLFLTFEGIEGAGKTTQVEMLGDALRAAGRECVTTFEPGGGGEVGRKLRALLKDPDVWSQLELAEIYLYAADRAHHIEKVIRPALDAGQVVLCDRYLDSTRAYQGFGRERDLELIESVHRLAPLNLIPDRTYVLDLPAAEGLQRAHRRRLAQQGRDANEPPGYDDADERFFSRVRQGFRAIADAEPDRVHVVDALRDVDSIHHDIVEDLATLVSGLRPLVRRS